MKSRQLPSLNALRAFEAVGRTGRMMHAADELRVTHGAVSRQVRSLETELGVSLFNGPKNNLSLSSEGTELLYFLTPAFDQMELGIRTISDTDYSILDVSCLGTFMMRWLIPRLNEFNKTHPAIDVRFSASSTDVEFGRDRFDVAIRVGSDPWPEDATVISLFPDYIGPVLSPSLQAGLRLKKPSDIMSFPILYSKSRSGAWAQWCDTMGVSTKANKQAVEYEHLYFVLEAALSGLGACMAPWSAVKDDIAAGRLSAPFDFVPSGQRYVALTPETPSRKAEAFCQWLKKEADRAPAIPQAATTSSGEAHLKIADNGD